MVTITHIRISCREQCEKDLVSVRPAGVPIHCIHVNGDPESKLIRGYVEYFGVMRVVMCLSSSYSGNVFSTTYAIDPTTGEELNLSVDLDLDLTDIRKAYNNEKLDEKVIQKAIDAVIGPTLKKAAWSQSLIFVSVVESNARTVLTNERPAPKPPSDNLNSIGSRR